MVHIAIGDNFAFGHGIRSHIHADLVIRRPSLHIDGKTVIDRGEPQLPTIATWRQGPETPPIHPLSLIGWSVSRSSRRSRAAPASSRGGCIPRPHRIRHDRAGTMRSRCGVYDVVATDEWHRQNVWR